MHDITPTNAVMRQPNRSTNDPVNGPRENIKANPTEPTQAGREQNSLNHCAVTVSGYSQTCIMRPSFTRSPSIKLSLAIFPEIISLNYCSYFFYYLHLYKRSFWQDVSYLSASDTLCMAISGSVMG